MWSTESCYENRFLIAIGDVSKDSVIEGRHPLRAGNKIHLIKMSKKMSAFKHPTQNTKMGKERSKICKERLHSDVGKWIIQKGTLLGRLIDHQASDISVIYRRPRALFSEEDTNREGVLGFLMLLR